MSFGVPGAGLLGVVVGFGGVGLLGGIEFAGVAGIELAGVSVLLAEEQPHRNSTALRQTVARNIGQEIISASLANVKPSWTFFTPPKARN